MKKLLLQSLFSWVLCVCVSASPGSPLQHIVSEFGSNAFFVMGESADGKVATGRCFKISDDGQISPLWETEGFYARSGALRLTPDGKTLVRLHTITVSSEGGNTPLISVYREGRFAYSLAIDKFLSWKNLKLNSFTGIDFITLDAAVESPFEIMRRFSIAELTGAEKISDQVVYDLKLSTANGKTFLIDLSNGKILTETETK